MTEVYARACHGLWVGSPVDELAAYLNHETPPGVHFITIGGSDPRPDTDRIIDDAIAAARRSARVVFIGHSLGSMLAFYLADALKAAGLRAALIVAIDPTGWGTNAPGVPLWSEVVFPPNTGRYFVPDSVDVFLHFRQYVPPGGGTAELAAGNKTTHFETLTLASQNHLSIVNCDEVCSRVLAAVKTATATPAV